MLNCDVYLTPGSLDEVFDLIEQHRGAYRLIAGATDLLPWAREGRAGDVHYPALIDISRVSELSGVERRNERIWMGANTTIQQFLSNPILNSAMPVMPQCAVWFADDQIREQATLGGNLVNASPAADTAPPMLAMNAQVYLASRKEGKVISRFMPLAEFIKGPGNTALRDGELLTAIECDALDGYGGVFKKVGHRRSLVISVACAATLVQVDLEKKRFTDLRMAFGGIGPVPVRLTEAEHKLRNAPLELDSIHEAVKAIPADLIRSRSRQAYRREVSTNFVLDSIIEALAAYGLRFSESGILKEVEHA